MQFTDDEAKAATGVALLSALAWRAWRAVRGDLRNDHAGAAQQQTYDRLMAAQKAMIVDLENEVVALKKERTILEQRVSEEIGKRYATESALRAAQNMIEDLRGEQ